MLRRHITCQFDRRRASPAINVRGLEALRSAPPVGFRHRQLATWRMGSPPERGAKAYAIWFGHVSAPDPRLALIKVRVLLLLESRDLVVSDLGPIQGGPGPVSGVQSVLVEVLDPARRFRLCIQGSGTFPWGPGPIVGIKEYIVSSSHVAGSGAVCHVARGSRMESAPSHCTKGYL
jgi:hypothetical protein